MRSKRTGWLLPLTLLIALPSGLRAQLRLPALFGDGMVVQRGQAIPVWGWSQPGAQVVVALDGRGAVADAAGGWRVVLPALRAGGPHTLSVSAGADHLQVRDILAGDVWVCSGQSNMELEVSSARNAAQEIGAARDPGIRQFKVARARAEQPAREVAGGSWAPADAEHVGAFSAVGYFFARALRRQHDVPIGLINATWGGTRIEPWTSARAQGLGSAQLGALFEQDRAHGQAIAAALEKRIGGLPTEDGGLVEGRAVWADPALDDSSWGTMPVPGYWTQNGYEALDGIAWYRTAFELTAAEARAGVRLSMGAIDNIDISYVNGHEVGRTEQWNQPRLYAAPASSLVPGRNVLAVRVEAAGGWGGIYGDMTKFFLETSAGRRPLAGAWKFRVGKASVYLENSKIQLPTVLYNAMIHPLQAYPIQGVLWYQGEANADRAADARRYGEQFRTLILDWRAGWRRSDLPFLWIQLPNYMRPTDDPAAASAWALLRESQAGALSLPRTGQVVSIDLGEAEDIHPKNKQDVGARLSLVARKVVYGDRLVDSGPTYRAHRSQGGRLVIEFDRVGAGLKVKDGGSLRGFAIAGPDRRFVWADATIQGHRVVVRSDAVPQPVAVRYAWADNPDKANLYSADSLPAAPFRTDRW